MLPRLWLETAAEALPDIARDIAARVRAEIGEYASDPTGVISAETQQAVRQSLGMFMRSIASGTPLPTQGVETFRRLGRHEARAGRSHDTLQSAYRIASQVVMQRLLTWEHEQGVPRDVMASLSSSVFGFIDELARLSAEGYAQEREALVDHAQARAELLAMLVHRDGYSRRQLADAAGRAAWPLPATVTVIEICGGDDRVATLFGAGALAAPLAERHVAIVPGPLDVTMLRARAAAGHGDPLFAVSPTVPLAEVGSAARLAHRLRLRHDARERACDHVVTCDDLLIELLLDSGREAARALASSRLTPLLPLSPAKRVKYGRLLSAWLEFGTLNAEEPGVLDKHRQTLRYQCTQLEKMFGDALHERTARLELMLALRAALPLWERQAASAARTGNSGGNASAGAASR
ncbi:CdaR family protein [Jatrophihabitans endophyticus]|uniref:hypothetical protein n=1 Tax=Jatrophihabitans endophyticus TaxID=1206085 RepID=UPI000932E46C|nr:hypothetical protein [Jatrophihabitans endophyticus]